MTNIVKNLAALIKVKTIVTFCVLTVWMVQAILNGTPSDAVSNITMMVVAFYFGTQAEKNSKEV